MVEHGGFGYDSDAYNDDLPYFTEVKGKRHLIVPYTFVYNDGRFVLPQGFGGPSDFVDLCKRAIDELLREGRGGRPKMMTIGLHPRWMGQAGRISSLREVIEYALGQGDVDISGVVEALESRGYDGWYVIEQDTAITDGLPGEGEGPIEQVITSMDYLRDVVAPRVSK